MQGGPAAELLIDAGGEGQHGEGDLRLEPGGGGVRLAEVVECELRVEAGALDGVGDGGAEGEDAGGGGEEGEGEEILGCGGEVGGRVELGEEVGGGGGEAGEPGAGGEAEEGTGWIEGEA